MNTDAKDPDMKKLSSLLILPFSAIAGMGIAFLVMNGNSAKAGIPEAIAAQGEVTFLRKQ